MKKVLIIGSGGREHALGWKLSQSEQVDEIFYAPGNGGTVEGKGRNLSIKPEDFSEIQKFIERKNIDLTVVDPEQPLVNGLVDFLHEGGYLL